MIVPRHWAEARLQHRQGRRSVTVRRFGWSDESEAHAQAHAEARAREALDRVLAGETLPRNERRVAYNGADGMPIREEIVDRLGDAVVTRNGYGALCLNTPDLLFADIDFAVRADRRHLGAWRLAAGVLVAAAILALPSASSARFVVAIVIGALGGLIGGGMLSVLWRRLRIGLGGGFEAQARRRIADFLASRPDWRLRVYRTPAGVRLMAVHRPFDPCEPAVREAFEALDVDPVFARMCFNQRCFRARLTPKPWRIGLQRLRPPSSAAWEPRHALLPARQAWIEAYQRRAAGYAACRHLETLGGGAEDPALVPQREFHDLVCAAERDLPLA
ncbi:MAG: hypothetical protein JF600_00905 [Xanthomonadales bacterium]|nr:hypothetical protein [Xanthomonadales bacterium]